MDGRTKRKLRQSKKKKKRNIEQLLHFKIYVIGLYLTNNPFHIHFLVWLILMLFEKR